MIHAMYPAGTIYPAQSSVSACRPVCRSSQAAHLQLTKNAEGISQLVGGSNDDISLVCVKKTPTVNVALVNLTDVIIR